MKETISPNSVVRKWDRYWGSEQQSTFAGKFARWFYLLVLPKFLYDLQVGKHIKIMDIGCGKGTSLSLFRQLGFRNSIGIDLSDKGLSHCKTNFNFQLGEDVFKMDARRTPYSSESFDLVFSEGLLEHFIDFTPFVQEMARLSKRHIIVIQPNHLSIEGAILKFAWLLFRKKSGGVLEYTYPISYFIKTFEYLGFRCIKKKYTFGNVILGFERDKRV